MGERRENSCFPVILEKRCTGCGNCSRVCPKHCLIMAKDKAGFTVSKIVDPDACLNCGACKAVCPELSSRQALSVKSLPKCYAAWHKDADIVEGILILRNTSLKLKMVVDNAILLNYAVSSENISESIKIKTENGFYLKRNVCILR